LFLKSQQLHQCDGISKYGNCDNNAAHMALVPCSYRTSTSNNDNNNNNGTHNTHLSEDHTPCRQWLQLCWRKSPKDTVHTSRHPLHTIQACKWSTPDVEAAVGSDLGTGRASVSLHRGTTAAAPHTHIHPRGPRRQHHKKKCTQRACFSRGKWGIRHRRRCSTHIEDGAAHTSSTYRSSYSI